MNRSVRAPQTILVYVGLDLIGDGLMKLPFVRMLRAAFPLAHITWVAGMGKSVYAGDLRCLVEGLIDDVIEDAKIGMSYLDLFDPPPPATGAPFRSDH